MRVACVPKKVRFPLRFGVSKVVWVYEAALTVINIVDVYEYRHVIMFSSGFIYFRYRCRIVSY